MGCCLIAALGKLFSFIPRLVVHKVEVQKIFHPDRPLESSDEIITQDQVDNGVLQDADLDVSDGSIFLRGVVLDVSAIRRRVRQLVVELPEHMRTAPVILTKLATELPVTLAHRAIELPSNLISAATDLPTTIISLAEGVEGTLEAIVQISSDVAREVVELPHRASFEWKQLFWVLVLLVLAPVVIFGLVFFVPMNSVNDGIENNRTFVYGIMTFYQVLTIAPWIETCNFAMPKARIPLRARIITLVCTLTAAKIFDAILVEGILGKSIFPIPFSILLSGLIGFLGVVPMLSRMTPLREKAGFHKMDSVLCAYWISFILVILWAVGVHHLRGKSWWQSVVITLYGPLRFICKILLAAPITTEHNPYRWIQLNLVVDIIFTRVQVSTFPFIDSFVTLLMLFSTEVLTLAWRYYSGVDRLALWWNAMYETTETTERESGRGWTDWTPGFVRSCRRTSHITRECMRAPIPLVAELNLSLREKQIKPDDILRTLTGETLESVEESPGVPALSSGVAESCQSVEDVCALDIEEACDIADEHTTRPSTEVPVNSETVIIQLCEEDKHGLVRLRRSDAERSQRSLVSVDLNGSGDDSCNSSSSGLSEDGLPDLLAMQRFASICSRTVLAEEDWEQRPLYHVVDATGANVISIIVRVNQQLSITMVRGLPSLNHLNESFEISDENWMKAQIYGWTFIVLMLLLLALVGLAFFHRLRPSADNKLSLSRVMSYLFKDHFWFFFLWLVSTGAFVCASMVNHFGADFSMRFKWVSCTEEMAWPGCPE